MHNKQGQLVIISSPSGGGKNSVINALLDNFSGSARFITTTTRPPRPGDKDGVDYFFVTEAEFQKKLARGDFLEHNQYAGSWYGTDKVALENLLAKHPLVFSQIEVNGKQQLDQAGVRHVAIFLLPESLEQLRARIVKRGGLTEAVIAERLRIAAGEIETSGDYDYRVVNREGKLAETVGEIRQILERRLGGLTMAAKYSRIRALFKIVKSCLVNKL